MAEHPTDSLDLHRPEDPGVGKKVGNYVITRSLGGGAMGNVYEAEHPQLGRRAAIKFLSPHLSVREDMAQRFISEARAVASIDHPNVVSIFDFGELDGQMYYAMELLRGRELTEVINEREPFTPAELLPYLEQICSALGAAHAAHIVHRDLKPGNILVLSQQPVSLKLIDFGIARTDGPGDAPHLTMDGMVMGTPRYISPEQAAGRVDRICPRTDLYSLGVIMFRMLTGRPPFDSRTSVMLMAKHIRERPPSVRDLAPAIPRALSDLIAGCLEKEPRDRPASADALVHAFAEAMDAGAPAPAPGPIPAMPGARVGGPAGQDEPRAAPGHPVTSLDQAAWAATVELNPGPPPRPGRQSARPNRGPRPAPRLAAGAPSALAAAAAQQGGDQGPPAPVVPAVTVRDPAPPTTDDDAAELDAQEGPAFEALLRQMQKKGDLPAITRSIGEINQRALFTSSASAVQLSESICKDYSLSAKLLQLVNSAYYERLTGSIKTVSRAVVMLGFDQVRMAAISLTLFKDLSSKERSAELYDAAISSLMSGEIAKRIADRIGVETTEETFLCAMFFNVGKHLVMYYLPRKFDQIEQVIAAGTGDEEQASRFVLGLSYQKLGIMITRRWRLSDRLVQSLKHLPPGEVKRPRTEVERLRVASGFANEVCQVIATVPDRMQQQAMDRLKARYGQSLKIDRDEIDSVVKAARDAVVERYVSALDLEMKSSKLLKKISRTPDLDDAPGAAELPAIDAAAASDAIAAAPAGDRAADSFNSTCALPPGPAAAGGSAGRFPDTIDVGGPAQSKSDDVRRRELLRQIEAISGAIRDQQEPAAVLRMIVETAYIGFDFHRVLLFILEASRDRMQVRAGQGPGIGELIRTLTVPLDPNAEDLFSIAIAHRKDQFVRHAGDPRFVAQIPTWYREQIAAPTFMLYPLSLEMKSLGLIYADYSQIGRSLGPEEMALLDRLRNQAIQTLRLQR